MPGAITDVGLSIDEARSTPRGPVEPSAIASRGAVGIGLAAVLATVSGFVPPLHSDCGTRAVDDSADLRGVLADHNGRLTPRSTGAANVEVFVTGVIPWHRPTRMEQIHELTGLPWRALGDTFGVSHTLARRWAQAEPSSPRPELDEALKLLVAAAYVHTDLAAWFERPIAGMRLKPRDLLAAHRWRAVRAAIYAAPAPDVELTADEIQRRRSQELSWSIPEQGSVQA